jgi:hypothetical protein
MHTVQNSTAPPVRSHNNEIQQKIPETVHIPKLETRFVKDHFIDEREH